MCLEAFFYDYAATEFGDKFTKEHLDKLDLKSKFLVFPRLVCGRSINKSETIYQKVGQLSIDRNYLVHFKSKAFDYEKYHEAIAFRNELNSRFRQGLENAKDVIPMVMKAVGELHGIGDYYFNMVCS